MSFDENTLEASQESRVKTSLVWFLVDHGLKVQACRKSRRTPTTVGFTLVLSLRYSYTDSLPEYIRRWRLNETSARKTQLV